MVVKSIRRESQVHPLQFPFHQEPFPKEVSVLGYSQDITFMSSFNPPINFIKMFGSELSLNMDKGFFGESQNSLD